MIEINSFYYPCSDLLLCNAFLGKTEVFTSEDEPILIISDGEKGEYFACPTSSDLEKYYDEYKEYLNLYNTTKDPRKKKKLEDRLKHYKFVTIDGDERVILEFMVFTLNKDDIAAPYRVNGKKVSYNDVFYLQLPFKSLTGDDGEE